MITMPAVTAMPRVVGLACVARLAGIRSMTT